MSERIAILGAGSWGEALAYCALRNQHVIRIWVRDKSKYKNNLYISDDLHAVCDSSDYILYILRF